MKEQTPLERLISQLEKEIAFIRDDDAKEDRLHRQGLRVAKELAETYLPEERKVIEEAYSSAQSEMLSVILTELKSKNVDLSSIPVNYMGNVNFIDKEDATEYFTTKFKQ